MQGITQVLDPAAGRAENLAEFTIANTLPGSLNILGAVSKPEDPQLQASRVNVEFTAFDLQLGSGKVTIPLGWVKPKVIHLPCLLKLPEDAIFCVAGLAPAQVQASVCICLSGYVGPSESKMLTTSFCSCVNWNVAWV